MLLLGPENLSLAALCKEACSTEAALVGLGSAPCCVLE